MQPESIAPMTSDLVGSHSVSDSVQVLRWLSITGINEEINLMNYQMSPIETKIKEVETAVSPEKLLHMRSTWAIKRSHSAKSSTIFNSLPLLTYDILHLY